MWSQKERAFFGLTKKEFALLRALQKRPLNTSELAITARLPRVTALRLLTKLWKRGFVGRRSATRQVIWSLMSERLLRRRLEVGLDKQGSLGKYIPLSDIAGVSVYKGVREMMASNQKILGAHAGERIYCIEPNGIWKHASKIPAKEWTHLNTLLKQRQVIAEVIIEEGFEKYLKSHVHEIWSESFFSIAKDIRVMPAGFIASAVETIIFRDRALFLDWEQLIAVEVANAGTVQVMKGLFRQLQQTSLLIERRK